MKKVCLAVLIAALFCVFVLSTPYRSELSTDIYNYDAECKDTGNASAMMPDIKHLGNYTEIKYTHQTTCHSTIMKFYSDGLALFVKYSQETYEQQKAQALVSYRFLEEPILHHSNGYELPVAEFDYNGSIFKIVPDEDYIDFCACKSFMMLGFNDDACIITYLYYFDSDLDYIAEAGDVDLSKEMRKLVDDAFCWVKL